MLASGEGFEPEPVLAALPIAVTGGVYSAGVAVLSRLRMAPALAGIAAGFTIIMTQMAAMSVRHSTASYAWNLDVIMFACLLAVGLSALALYLIARRPFAQSPEMGCAMLAAAATVMLLATAKTVPYP